MEIALKLEKYERELCNLYFNDNFKQIIKIYKNLYYITNFVEYLKLIGFIYFYKLSDYKKSIKYLKMYAEQIPDNILANYVLSTSYAHLKNYKKQAEIVYKNINFEIENSKKEKDISIIIYCSDIKSIISHLYNIQVQSFRNYRVICITDFKNNADNIKLKEIFNFDRRFIFIEKKEFEILNQDILSQKYKSKWFLLYDYEYLNLNFLNYILQKINFLYKNKIIIKTPQKNYIFYKTFINLLNSQNIKDATLINISKNLSYGCNDTLIAKFKPFFQKQVEDIND